MEGTTQPFLALQVVATSLVAVMISLCAFLRLNRRKRTIGLFHPYCDAGGGGERVLFCAIKYLPKDWDIVVYTGDSAAKEEILTRCKMRFGEGSTPSVADQERVKFVYLKTRFLVEAATWPRLTLIGQSLGSVILGFEALLKCSPEVYLDTMGYAFTFPLAGFLCGSRVGCYVHYPTISKDMLQRVFERRPTYNNSSRIARSKAISTVKYVYYYLFSLAYGLVGGGCSLCTMVNSTWTKNHIDSIWRTNANLVFPPCLSTKAFEESQAKLESKRDESLIISIGQFRPEKDHRLQLAAVARYRDKYPESKPVKLVLIGSCRGKEDRDRVNELKNHATSVLGLEEGKDFDFKVDATKAEVDELYEKALIGLHTMWNEHFGIGLVEMMAAGVLVIAHDSGGPRFDIVKHSSNESERAGYLASNEDEYADAIWKIEQTSADQRRCIREQARKNIVKFTEEEFGTSFLQAIQGTVL